MGRLILDTSVLIAVERRTLSWTAVAADDDDTVIAAITAAELLRGTHASDPDVRARRVTEVEADLERLAIVDYDLAVARVHAELLAATARAGRPRGPFDLIIAATARATDRTVVTLDRAGFDGLPGVSVRVPA